MLKTFLGTSKIIKLLLTTSLFISLFYIFSDNLSFAGVAIPPKDLMYKHDPGYKSPDLDPEDPAAKQELPPKIYYYKKGAVSEYYRNSGKYVSPSTNQKENNSSYQQTPYQQTQENNHLQTTNTTKKNNSILILTFLFIILILALSNLIITIKQKQEEAKRIPVYEKYSTKPIRKKRETIFDKVK